jgi:predicted transposase YdaD
MSYITSIERSGIETGRMQERREMVLKFLGKRLNGVSSELQAQVEALSSEQLQELNELLMDAASIDDLTAWLNQH